MDWSKDTLVGRLESGNLTDLKKDINLLIHKKLENKIKDMQKSFRDSFNGVEEEG